MKTYSYHGHIVTANSKEEEAIQKIVASPKQANNEKINFGEWIKTNYNQIKELTGFTKVADKDNYYINFIKKEGKFTLRFKFSNQYVYAYLEEGKIKFEDAIEKLPKTIENCIKFTNNFIKKSYSNYKNLLKYKNEGFKSLCEKTLKSIVSSPLFKEYKKNKVTSNYYLPGYKYELTKNNFGLEYIISIRTEVNGASKKDPITIGVSYTIKSEIKNIKQDFIEYGDNLSSWLAKPKSNNMPATIAKHMDELDNEIADKGKYQEEVNSLKKEVEVLNKNKDNLVKKANDGLKLLVNSKLTKFFKSCAIEGDTLKLFVADKYTKNKEIDRIFKLDLIIDTSKTWKKLNDVLKAASAGKLSFKFSGLDEKDYSVSYKISLN